ncbi:MAG TPA: hypothetical protein VHC39_02595 [Rhizomicrobium sp.]|nr:hypothetical protein [Rhizomicrobium sp.]
MEHDPDPSRPARAGDAPGKQVRLHLLAFGRQVVFILLCGLSALLLDRHRPEIGLSLMRTMFAFSTLFLAVVALAARQRPSKTIGMWDHVIAMLILTLICSVALQFFQR